MKSLFSIFILTFIIFSTASHGASANEVFAKETKLYWKLLLTENGNQSEFTGEGIDQRLKKGISHKDLEIHCKIKLEREHIKYEPSGKSGYTRDEERAFTFCKYGQTQIDLEMVKCARGYGQKGIGTIYSDKTEISLKKEPHSFGLKLSCFRK